MIDVVQIIVILILMVHGYLLLPHGSWLMPYSPLTTHMIVTPYEDGSTID
jgi:hypothetical protein